MSTTDTRIAFEYWFSDEGAHPKAIERSSSGGYILAAASSAWNVWQAATDAAKAAGTAGEPHRTVAEIDSDIATGGGLGRMDRLLKERARAEAARQPAPSNELRRAGAALSNIAFNLSQRMGHALTERECANMKECQAAWDKALRAQPAPVVPEIVEIDAVGILREFVADSHEHDVGGGDLVITTCEVREKAVALLKLLQDPELGECGCKPSDCPNNQKCKCVAATNRSQP